MGLSDATYVIVVRGRPVALLYTGQHCPPEGADEIVARVDALGTGQWGHIRLMESVREELKTLAHALPQAPADFEDRLRREAEHIERIAEAEYSREKYQWEQSFLDRLRRPALGNSNGSLEAIRADVEESLKQVQAFCRSDYAIFFAGARMNDTVLIPIGWTGIPVAIGDRLPHFNWKKAGFSAGPADWTDPAAPAARPVAAIAGIRGDNSEFFAHAVSVIPTTLGAQYRGVLMLGPFRGDHEHRRRTALSGLDRQRHRRACVDGVGGALSGAGT